MSEPNPLTPDAVLEQSEWLRRLTRSLVLQEDRADDVMQETLLRAIGRRGQTVRSIRPWLARVAGNVMRSEHTRDGLRRDAESRRAAEQGATRSDGDPGPDQVVEQAEMHRRVNEAALALDEPYRSTILLRYLRGWSCPRIADHMAVPVETVRTRIKRGLAQLRTRLDQEHGGCRGWALPILGATGLERILPTAASLSSSFIVLGSMNKTMTAVSAAMLAALLWMLWPATSEPELRSPTSPAPTADLTAKGVESPEGTGTTSSDAPVRVAVPEESGVAPTLGSLLVRVRWSVDEKAAVGVTVRTMYERGGALLFDQPSGLTDERGILRIESLRPGPMLVQVYRGGFLFLQTTGKNDGPKRVTIEAGRETEVDLEIPVGLDVSGIVIDPDGDPVAGADIVVAPIAWIGVDPGILTASGPDGRFRLRSIAIQSNVGARARDHAPSLLHSIRGAVGDDLEVRIVLGGRGGSIRGQVIDSRGQPVGNATIQVGERGGRPVRKMPSGRNGLTPNPVRVRSDAEGRFAVDGLAPGRTAVVVRSRGSATWFGVEDVVSGHVSETIVSLLPAVTLSGTARDGRGAPLAKALVSEMGVNNRVFGPRQGLTDASGVYRIEDLGPGELKFSATWKGAKAITSLIAVAGENLRWDPVISEGMAIRGRVVDEHDKPVRVTIHAGLRSPAAARNWNGWVQSNEAGRFEIKNCPPGEVVWIEVHSAFGAEKSVPGVQKIVYASPGGPDLQIRLPAARRRSVYFAGRVLRPDGEPVSNCSVKLWHRRASFGSITLGSFPGRGDGSFKIGPYSPGEYRVRVEVAGHPVFVTDWKTLSEGETWNLNDVRMLRPGYLQVNLQGGADLIPQKGRLRIEDAAGHGDDAITIRNGRAERSRPMAAGKYFLLLAGERLLSARLAFEIRAGEVTHLEVQLDKGIPVTMEFLVEVDGQRIRTRDAMVVEVRDPNGRVVPARNVSGYYQSVRTFEFGARPGKYDVVATTMAGHRGEFAVTVRDRPVGPKRIVLR